MSTHPVPSHLGRRAVLRGVALGVLTAGAAGCGRDSPARPLPADPLIAQEALARADAASMVTSSPLLPDRTDALRIIAAERNQHANTLRAEINRRTGVYEDGTTPAVRGATSTGAPVPLVVPVQTLDQLRERLETARRSAAELAKSQQGYRAGLLASVSAACAVHGAVLLR